MTELLLVGIGRMGRPYLDACDRLGVAVRAVETPAVLAELAGRLAGGVPVAGPAEEDWAAAADRAARDRRPAGVLAFNEPQVLAAALVADRLGLPGPSLAAAVISRNKALQRGRFAARGLPQPEHRRTDGLAAARDWAVPRLPVVVKPLSAAGSEGVQLVAGRAGYDAAAATRTGPLLVEAYAAGPEVSWEALVRDGRVWFANVTAKETTGPPDFVELVHRTAADRPELADLGAAVVDAIGLRTGIAHLEVVLTDAGPRLLEVAVRTPGDYLLDALGLTYDLDWYEVVVRLALGLPLPDPPTGPAWFAASCYLTAPPGRLVGVDGLAAARAHPAVTLARVRLHPGDQVGPLRSSADRVGNALLRARTRTELEAGLAHVRATVRVRTDPLGSPDPEE